MELLVTMKYRGETPSTTTIELDYLPDKGTLFYFEDKEYIVISRTISKIGEKTYSGILVVGYDSDKHCYLRALDEPQLPF